MIDLGVKPTQRFPGFRLLGTRYSCGDVEAVSTWLTEAALAGVRGYVCIANSYTATLTRLDARYRAAQRGSLGVFPDGMPLVWAGRALGRSAHRVYGADLMWRTLDEGRRHGLRHYLLGGTDELLATLRQRIDRRLPGVMVVGASAPPFMEADDPRWTDRLSDVARTQPHVTWVGLGAPKQELLMAQVAGQPGIMVGVGQAFALNADPTLRVPGVVQSLGLEWAFRLAAEPRRLWRRYLLHNPLFLALAVPEVIWMRLLRTDEALRGIGDGP